MTEDYSQYEDEMPSNNNQQKIFMYITIALAIALLALTFQYFNQVNMLRGSEEELMIERDTLHNSLILFTKDLANLETENDTINQLLISEKYRADSLLKKMKQERNWSYSQINKYKKELTTMRGALKTFVIQIDSLNQLNHKLSRENISMKKVISNERLRADAAEENVQELNSRVREGSIIKARDIDLKALRANDKETNRAKRASSLRVDLTLNENPLAIVGEKDIYVRIKGPENVLLTTSASTFFMFEDQKIAYTSVRRNIDYQGEALPVGIYYSGDNITGGTYFVEVYMDGYLIGSNEIILK